MGLMRLRLVAVGVVLLGARAWGQEVMPVGGEPVVKGVEVGKLAYDYLVDGELKADEPGERKFRTLEAAVAAAPEGVEGKPVVIGIRPGVYRVEGSMEPRPSLRITKNWITLLGLTDNRRAVVIADNRGLAEGASDNGYLLDVEADGFTAKNLTILNYCNIDYSYPGDSTKDLKKRNPVITQAVALQARGDKHVYENVAILSRLDTMFLRTTRSYFKNVYIVGTDDWMGGGGMSVWEDCVLGYPMGSGVMSASNCVFIRCRFEAERGFQFYKSEFSSAGRPVAVVECVLPKTSKEGPVAWVRGPAVARVITPSLTYRNVDAEGKAAAIWDDSVSGEKYTYGREMSEEERKAFNPWNLLRGTDGWDPAGVKKKYEGLGRGVYRVGLRMSMGVGEEGRVLEGGLPGKETVAPVIRTGGGKEKASVVLVGVAMPRDAEGREVRWEVAEGKEFVELKSGTGGTVEVVARNSAEKMRWAGVRAVAGNGMYAMAWVKVEPRLVDSPAVVVGPRVMLEGGKARVSYELELKGREDESVVSWWVCEDASGKGARKVWVSRVGSLAAKAASPVGWSRNEYRLVPGDVGKVLRVSVEPKSPVSEAGAAVFAMSERVVRAEDVLGSEVRADVRGFVTEEKEVVPGRWAVTGEWSVVEEGSLAEGWGLKPAVVRGTGTATTGLYYVGEEGKRDMEVRLVVWTEKTEGTVFSSPGSPMEGPGRNTHADVYVRYDPRTGEGYSLRLWRTTGAAGACSYQFYKIVGGVGTEMGERATVSGAFKRNATVRVWARGSEIGATVENTTDAQRVDMKGRIEEGFGGTGVGMSMTGAPVVIGEARVVYP